MSFEDSASDREFGNLFGSEDEASDIDDGRDQSSEEEQQQQQQPVSATKPATNDMDNLFGSEEEESESESEKRQTLKQKSSRFQYSDEEEQEQPDYDESDNDSQNKKQRVEVSLEMPQLPVPYSDTNKYYLAKLPQFLDIEVTPFDPDEFEVQVEEGLTQNQEQEAIREQIESTIRWRRIKQNNSEIMQSNAHLVEWEDGKMSLMLGDECFDVSNKQVGTHEHVYLLAHQTGSGALESHLEFTDRMTFRPSGLKSDTHRYLTAQIADKQIKKQKTKMFFTEKDPELMKQELEKLENERLNAQKKLELQRRKADMRYGDVRRTQEFGDYDTADYSSYPQSSRTQDKYEDDFVVDDDDYDEEEERSRENRLSQAKRSGMDKYNKRSNYSEEEEDEDYGNEEEEDEEEIVVRRHKRHRISSDEDE